MTFLRDGCNDGDEGAARVFGSDYRESDRSGNRKGLIYLDLCFLRVLTMISMQQVAEQVYGLATSNDPLAPLVKEALTVIDEGLDICG